MTELLQQVRLIDPEQRIDRVADVLIQEGVITAIADSLQEVPAGTESRDCRDLILGPGLVDLYSTCGEPGYEHRETLAQLLETALSGGFTRLNLLPQTHPPLTTPGAVQQLLKSVPATSPLQVRTWGAITQELAGQALTELQELWGSGITGLSDGQPLADAQIMRRLLDYTQGWHCPVALWPCDLALAQGGVIRESVQALRFGLPSLPLAAETAPLAALLECLSPESTPVHLMRISTARSLDLIAQAKARGLPVTASTTWMHLLKNCEALVHYDPMLRLDPPLGNPADQAALIEAVASGLLDAVAVDHHVYTYEEKTVPFAQAPPGCPGLGQAFAALWQAFVASDRWSPAVLWRSLSQQPARCLQQAPPRLEVGQPAEMILFEPGAEPLGQVRQVWANWQGRTP
ncbi:dihydroorotase [Lyngbya confervoides]|uniref:Dihydroorotase n=1 Tax=Lyngbya confervoides BDU141951 TaxID=1574623 RepID=A0ABD4SYL4_9CYAN|nr:dihydroorotase [Lyngbya confervoides]MCM1981358.1 dihydroorotase [Lyngbya confervoides BDU141951]